MIKKREEDAFVAKVISTLDESSDRLNADNLSRLAEVRAKALNALDTDGGVRTDGVRQTTGVKRQYRRRTPMVAFVAASAAVLVVAVILLTGPVSIQRYGDPADVELLASTEQLELLDELDFYSWLVKNEDLLG